MNQMRPTHWIALGCVLVLALLARLSSVGWDGYAGLHPDERHLLFISRSIFDALGDPAQAGRGLSGWWFAPDSPLNPHAGAASYVYGEAPLFAAALIGWALGATDWFAFIPVARGVSSVVDVLAVLAVFMAARMLAGGLPAVAAAAIYAAMPSALQLSSFHTVDVWLTASSAGALACLIALVQGRGAFWGMAAGSGALIGLAMASKIPGVLLFAPAGVALLALMRDHGWRRVAGAGAVMALAALVVFRLANPFAFAGPGLFGILPSPDWIEDFRGLAEVTASPAFPPNWQWEAGYGPLRLARDFVLFGAGPVAVALLVWLRDWRAPGVLVTVTLIGAFVALMALSSVAALRYGSPALAGVAVLSALGLRVVPLWGGALAMGLALWWGAGAWRLHDGAHPRLLASQWLWALPRGTILTNETSWDESLPTIIRLPGEAGHRWPTHDGWFTHQVLEITDPDSPEKAARIAAMLARTDFLILSSDRHSAVMPRLPDRFPMTGAHYRAILSGQACFTPVLELDRGFPLPGMRIDDAWAQEPWRVYDHPIVRIYLREPCFSEDQYRDMLLRALRR